MKDIEGFTKSKYLFIRHTAYFIISIGLIHLSIVLLVFTIIISIMWYFNDGYIAFKGAWKEYSNLLHEIWTQK